MLTSIDVKFTFNSARLGLFSSANILQLADVALRVVFLLFLPCFCAFSQSELGKYFEGIIGNIKSKVLFRKALDDYYS